MKRVRLKERKKHKKRLNVLLVDFSNLLYRATFANKTLTHQGIFTGGVYGFLRIISSLVDKYEVDQLVICKDTKPYFRAEVFPKYKTDRKTLEDEDDIRRIKQTIRLVGELVAMLHMLIAEEPGWEADDIIGTYCIKRWRFYKRILISSNDSDFFQFFSKERSNIFLCAKKGLYGYAQFKRDFPDIKTWQWPRIVALKGSHNGVPGIKGVGDKTAIKIVLSGTSNKELEAKYGKALYESDF